MILVIVVEFKSSIGILLMYGRQVEFSIKFIIVYPAKVPLRGRFSH